MKSKLLLILFLTSITYSSHAHEIAITFDDLPEASNGAIKQQTAIIQRILDALLQFQVPAIGFVNEGKLYSNTNDLAKKTRLLKLWIDNGFDLGNHTYSHLSLNTLTLEQFKSQVNQGSKISKKLMQEAGRNYQYFRHPYLHTGATPSVRTATEDFLKHENYVIAPVTIDTDDWKFNQQLLAHPENREKIIEAYLQHTRAKFLFYEDASRKIFGRNIRHIWLLHVNLLNSLTIKQLLGIAREFDYDFISLTQVLTDSVYQSPDNYHNSFGVSWLYRWDFTRGKVVDWSNDPEPDNYLQKLLSHP